MRAQHLAGPVLIAAALLAAIPLSQVRAQASAPAVAAAAALPSADGAPWAPGAQR